MPSPPSAHEHPALPHGQAHVQDANPPPAGTRISLESPFQGPGTQVTLILPDQRVRRVVLALPVEKGDGNKYGHSLAEIGRLPAHLRDGTAFAAPTFSQSPWLVNHATRTDCQQEDHLVRVVLPAVLAANNSARRPGPRCTCWDSARAATPPSTS